MRIAQVAPLWERVPPPAYGGIELIVHLLTDELVRRGHDVTLFATGDSQTLAHLDPGCEEALRLLNPPQSDYDITEQMMLSRLFSQANDFDIIHSHLCYTSLPYAQLSPTPVVHTQHGACATPLLQAFYRQHRTQNFISISNSQRRPELEINYLATVYNAIQMDQYQFYAHPANPPYLAFLGRMSEAKGPHLAIEIAKRTGVSLKMAGKNSDSLEFFETKVAPHIDGHQIEYLGEIANDQKNALLGHAIATLFPITWKEPFGLVMAESLACGTPVIGMALGAAEEVITHEQTGFLCQTVDECVAAVERISEIDRATCRSTVASNFNVSRMVDGYEAVYRQVLNPRIPAIR